MNKLRHRLVGWLARTTPWQRLAAGGGLVAAFALLAGVFAWQASVLSIAPNLEGVKLYEGQLMASQERPPEIANQSIARWLANPDRNATLTETKRVMNAAQTDNAVPLLVAYNIPFRDCGSYSAGGAGGGQAYRDWVQAVASGIEKRRAIVVLEPDALAAMDCLPAEGQRERTQLMAYAVEVLKEQTEAFVYIDAGNPGWKNQSTMAERLRQSNIERADGFTLNVSNFFTTEEVTDYGDPLAESVGKRYIIDTSRNGNGPTADNQWCNPPGRALGEEPVITPEDDLTDAYLWVKVPGESDGTCNGGPPAGQWWPQYAEGLVREAA